MMIEDSCSTQGEWILNQEDLFYSICYTNKKGELRIFKVKVDSKEDLNKIVKESHSIQIKYKYEISIRYRDDKRCIELSINTHKAILYFTSFDDISSLNEINISVLKLLQCDIWKRSFVTHFSVMLLFGLKKILPKLNDDSLRKYYNMFLEIFKLNNKIHGDFDRYCGNVIIDLIHKKRL